MKQKIEFKSVSFLTDKNLGEETHIFIEDVICMQKIPGFYF